MLVKLFHLFLLSVAFASTGVLFYRYYLIKKLTHKKPYHLKHWGISLLLLSLAVSLFLLWDFYPDTPNTFHTRYLFLLLVISGFLIFIISTFRLMKKIQLFWGVYMIFFSFFIIFIFSILFYYIAKNSSFYLQKDLIIPFVFLAPLELISAFLVLFLAIMTLGNHFFRWRILGFHLIASALIGLAALNLSRPWVGKTIGYWEFGYHFQYGFFLSVWEYLREIFYLLFFIGFYFATLPRIIKKDHEKEMIIDHQRIKISK